MSKTPLSEPSRKIDHEPGPGIAVSPDFPYVPERTPRRAELRSSGRVFVLGGGLVVLLLVVAFSGISHKPPAGQRARVETPPGKNGEAENDRTASLTPILDIGAPAAATSAPDLATPDQIERPAIAKPRPLHPRTLATVPPFEDRSWQPPPYPGPGQPEPGKIAPEVPNREWRGTARAADQDSLVFVSKLLVNSPPEAPSAVPSQRSFRLSPGTRLRARLESEINSAVKSPVVAVIEDNYERQGRLVIPAGARVIGRLISADRSGFVEVDFDSLDLVSDSSLEIRAIATDLDLRPLRGRVQGRATGKNLLVRSVTGIGEVAATLVGRGSLNQPLSEQDMLRERLSNNIGQAGNQQIAALAASQLFVVTVPAASEIYVVFEKEGALPMQKNSSSADADLQQIENPSKLPPGVNQFSQ